MLLEPVHAEEGGNGGSGLGDARFVEPQRVCRGPRNRLANLVHAGGGRSGAPPARGRRILGVRGRYGGAVAGGFWLRAAEAEVEEGGVARGRPRADLGVGRRGSTVLRIGGSAAWRRDRKSVV